MNLEQWRSSPEYAEAVRQLHAQDAATAAAATAAGRKRTTGEFFGDIGAQLLQGAVGIGQAAYGVGNMATLGLLDRGLGLSDNFKQTNEIINTWKSDPTQAAIARGRAAFDEGIGAGIGAYATDSRLMQDLLVSNLPSILPAGAGAQYAMRGLSGVGTVAAEQAAAKLAATGAARAGGIQAAGSANVDILNAAHEAGMGDTESQLAALGGGVLTGVMTPAVSKLTGAAELEAAVAAKLLGKTMPVTMAGTNLLKSAASGAAKEGLEETIQSGAEQAIQNVFTGKPISEDVAKNAALGGLAGTALGGGFGVYSGPRNDTKARQDVNQQLQEAASAAGGSTGGALTTISPASTAVATGAEGVRPVTGEVIPALADQPRLPAPPGTSVVPFQPRVVENAPGTLYVGAGGDVQTLDQLAQQFSGGSNPNQDLFGMPVQWDKVGRAATDEAADTEAAAGVSAPGVQGELFGGFSPLQAWVEALTQPAGVGVTPMTFDQAQQARRQKNAERVQAALGRVDSALADSQSAVVPLQQALVEQQRQRLAGIPESDILSVEDIMRQQMFAEHVDPTTGETTLTRYNPDLQRSETVSKSEADAEVKKATSWKEFFSKQLGLKPGDMQGKAWKAFSDAAVAAGVMPASPEAAAFLSAYSGQIDPEADLPKFALEFHKKFAPQVTEEAAPAPAAEPAPSAPAAAPAAPVEEAPIVAFKMARQDKDTHTATRDGVVISFRKNLDASEGDIGTWEYNDPSTGAPLTFNAPTRADAKKHVEQLLEDATKGVQPNEDWSAGTERAPGTTTFASPAAIADTITQGLRPINTAKGKDAKLVEIADDVFDSISDLDALDEVFIAMKNTPEYAAASAKTKDMIAESFDLAYEELSGHKFSRNGTGKPVHEVLTGEHVAKVKETVDFANRNRTAQEGEVKLFNTVFEFEQATGARAPADAKGVYMSDGTVAVIAENLKDDKDAAMTVLHERTHEGMHGLLGENLGAVTNRLWANAGLRTRIKEKMKLGLDRTTAAEEVLTDMAENGEKLTGDVRSKLKSGVVKVFDKLLGVDGFVVNDGDVDALLRDVVKYRTSGASEPTSRMGQVEAMRELDNLLVASPSDKFTSIRFSRAIDDLERLATESPDADGNATRVFSGAVKDAGKMLNGMWSAVRKGDTNALWRAIYDAVPRTQLHATFGKMWSNTFEDGRTDNAFDRYNGAMGAKESFYNKLMRSDIQYGDGQATSATKITDAFEGMRKTNYAKYEKVNALIQYSTFYQLFPGRDVAEQPAATGVDAAEREQARVAIDRLWKQVGPDGQKLFDDVQAFYKHTWTQRYTALKETLAKAKGVDLSDTKSPEYKQFMHEFGTNIDAQIHRLGHAPYSPLRRFGDYMVAVRDQNGALVDFTGHDSEADARKFAADQRARYGAGYSVSSTMQQEFNWEMDGLKNETIRKMEASVDASYSLTPTDTAAFAALSPADQSKVLADNRYKSEMAKSVKEALLDTYLHSLPQHSLMQHANARKYVSGFPMDAGRAFSAYALGAARNVSNIVFDGDINKALTDMGAFVREKGEGNDDGMKMMSVFNAVRNQYDGTKKAEYSAVADVLTTASFLKYMTSPSQGLLNVLQTALVAAPRMAAKFGSGASLSSLTKAHRQFFTKEGLLNNPEVDQRVRNVLQELHEGGTDDITLTNTMAGLADGQSSHLHGTWRTITQMASSFLHRTEVLNRQVTAASFAELYLKQNPNATPDELLRETKQFIDNESHFNYDKHNDAAIMQGPWRKAILQFQKYRLNMLAMMSRDIKQAFGSGDEAILARRTLAYMLGTQLALTGAAGTAIAPIVFAIMDAFRDDDDLLDSRTEFLRGHSQIIGHGMLSVLPLINIDPSRVETGSVLPIIGERAYAPKDGKARDEFNYYLTRNVGAFAGLLGDTFEGGSKIMDGDYGEGIAKLLPKPLADAYKAAVDFDGARDRKGVKYYQPDVFDSVKAVVGLRSGERLESEEKRGAVYQAEKHVKAVADRALTKVALGYSLGDAALQQEGTEKFMALAAAHPEMVKGSDLRRAIAGAAKAQYNADTYGVPQSARLSEEVLSAVERE